jgi:kynurenine formamidase
MHSMAKGGVLTQTLKITMHTGTHCDAPRHVMERMFDGRRALYTHELPVDAYMGDAVCLDVRTDYWQLITAKNLDDAVARAGMKPEELKGLVVVLRTGMHLKWDDSKASRRASGSCSTRSSAWPWISRPWITPCTPPWAITAPG